MKKLLLIPLLTLTFWLSNTHFLWATTMDTQIILHQQVLNRFFETLGPITGTSTIKGIPLNWKVTNPKLNIKNDKLVYFQANVAIQSDDGFQYSSIADGKVELYYDATQNIIIGTIKEAAFEIALTLFGTRIPLSKINITHYYTEPLYFPSPIPTTKNTTIKLPGGITKNIAIKSTNRTFSVEPEKVILTSNWIFDHIPHTPSLNIGTVAK